MSFRLLPFAAGVFAVVAAAPSHSAPPAPVLPEVAVVQAAPAPGPTDWPQWRGINRDGKSSETGLLRSWPKEGPPKVWTVTNMGAGFGTPSVAAGMIFGAGVRDGKDGVWGLNEADGSEVWFTPFADTPKTAPQNNGPASTPTYHEGKVYTVSGNGTLAAMDAKTGKLVWTRSYLKDFGGSVPTWGYSDSVLIDGKKLICSPSGSKAAVAALNPKTGATIWSTPINPVGGGFGYSSPIKMTVGNIPTYVCLLGDKAGIVGVHADTGKMLWQYNKKPAAGGVAQIPTPVFLGNKLWVSCSYSGGSALLELTPKGTTAVDVKELKSYPKPELNNHHGGMILLGKHVYFGHDQNRGVPACVDITTGEVAFKDDGEPKGMRGSVAISFADGRLYYRFQNHVLALVEPDPTEFKVVSSFTLPDASRKESWAHPVIANGRLYIRDQDKLHCFNIKAPTN
jgi:outer membrane protein assembly factor BamB